jgi:uncharacterized protein (TIGR02391 family)
MLSRSLYPHLTDLVVSVGALLAGIEAGVPSTEVDASVRSVETALRQIAEVTGKAQDRPFTELARHVRFVSRFYREGKPASYAADLTSIRDRDLPGVIACVQAWEAELLPPGLAEAIEQSWNAGNYRAAVRDGFVFLEDALRQAGGIDPARGLTAEKLINELLAKDSPTRIDLSGVASLGPVTAGEEQGVLHLFKGAFLLVRNAAAHRVVDYTPEQANEILSLISLCLRVIDVDGST